MKCANEGCKVEFIPINAANVYCSGKCSRQADNRRRAEAYAAKKAGTAPKKAKCAFCQAEFDAFGHKKYCSKLCKDKAREERKSSIKDKVIYCERCNAEMTVPIGSPRLYCDDCLKARRREVNAGFRARHPDYDKSYYQQHRGKKPDVKTTICGLCKKEMIVPVSSRLVYCDECRRTRTKEVQEDYRARHRGDKPAIEKKGKPAPRKAPVYTPEHLAEIRAAHGGRGEICRNCKRPFIRRYPGQTYCYAPECAKAAEREAMRMEAA